MTYRHKQTGFVMQIEWQSETEVGLFSISDAFPFCWCGTLEEFHEQWEET